MGKKIKSFMSLKHWEQRALYLYTVEGLSYKEIHDLIPDIPYDTKYGAIQRLKGLYSKETITQGKRLPTIFVIGDTQCKPSVPLDYMKWVGHYIAKKKPDIIVHIGDHWDFESLSTYDKGKRAAEGRRYSEDMLAGTVGLGLLEAELKKIKGYNPRKVFTSGNHEHRATRYTEDNPEIHGALENYAVVLERAGWEVYDFLEPICILGISFQHYVANPMTGKPMGGTTQNILKNCGSSFVMGHRQVLDLCIRPTLDGKHQVGVIVGACYTHFEQYKSYQGNNHFRGCVMLTEVQDGFALPSPVSLDYMRKVYEANH